MISISISITIEIIKTLHINGLITLFKLYLTIDEVLCEGEAVQQIGTFDRRVVVTRSHQQGFLVMAVRGERLNLACHLCSNKHNICRKHNVHGKTNTEFLINWF